jgi:hypothetical protein
VPEQPSAGVKESLHDLANKLRQAPPLGPDAQRILAELIDELGNTVVATQVPSTEVVHLAETTTHLLQALQRRHEPGRLAAARDRLETAILRAEATAPVMAGFARRLLDALANLGI